MDWVSNLFIALLMTDISGTLFYIIGMIFRKIWFKKDVRLVRFETIVVLGAYTVPLVYFVLQIGRWIEKGRHSSINLFYNTPRTMELFTILGWVWVELFLILLAYKLYCRHRWIMVCRGNIPEEDEMTKRRFKEICAELGIEGKVALCRNDSIEVPCITYYHGTVVILPLNKYTEEEVEIILYHELCHYLERDLPLRTFGIVVTLLHVFNPIVHIMSRHMTLVCEMSCDRLVCERAKNRFTEQHYFQVIFDMLKGDRKRERYQLFALVDDRTNYERRVACMSQFHMSGGIKKSAALVLAACFLLGSSFTSLAAGVKMTGVYEGYAEETSVKNSLENIDSENQKAIEEMARLYNLDPDNIVMMDDINMEGRGRTINIEWEMDAGETFMSGGFTESEGNFVEVRVVGDPKDVSYQTGIKDPDNIMNYVEGNDIVDFTYEVPVNGRYYFFVVNLSKTESLHINALIVK